MLKKNPVFLAVPFLWAPGVLPERQLFTKIRAAGIDGIEVLLTRHVLKNLDNITRLAEACGLDIAFHRWWPTGPEVDGWHNTWVMPHVFPRDDPPLWSVLPVDFDRPVVGCTYSLKTIIEGPLVNNFRLQPTPTGALPPEFLVVQEWISKTKTPIVFDLGHWLQYLHWPDRVPATATSNELLKALFAEFCTWSDRIVEIHVYGVEQFNATGMNRWPWESPRLDVEEFLRAVAKTSWRGQVTWEIGTPAFLPGSSKHLRRLPQIVRACGL